MSVTHIVTNHVFITRLLGPPSSLATKRPGILRGPAYSESITVACNMRKLLFCLLIVTLGAQAAKFDLSQLPWTLRNQNGSINVPGKVPSQVHLDLFAAGVITDPILGING